MAVYQISKIQIRRGKKNEFPIPQLASGELAWAIDAQELYIGNGSVEEGAPAVGNTKILTEKDNILDIGAYYQYKGIEVRRTLQSRLDDGPVNAASFGISPDVEIDASKFQYAIDQLSGTTLEFGPGTFKFKGSVKLKNNTKIVGSGRDVTIFEFINPGTAFETDDNATNIRLSGFTLEVRDNPNNNGILTYLDLAGVKNSVFSSLKLIYKGEITDGSSPDRVIGVKLRDTIANLGGFVFNEQNMFTDTHFQGLTRAVRSDSNASYNSFDKCAFSNLLQGVILGGVEKSSNYNLITNSTFNNVKEQAIIVINGFGNRSRSNTFINVGGDGATDKSYHSIIKFVTDGNSSVQDIFESQQRLVSSAYYPEIEGQSRIYSGFTNTLSILNNDSAFLLPLNGINGFEIDYILSSSDPKQYRWGTLYLVATPGYSQVTLTDEYEILGPSSIEIDAVFSASVEAINGVPTVSIKITKSPTNTYTLTYTVSSITSVDPNSP